MSRKQKRKQKQQKTRQVFALYFRNFIFGVEDSLVSTVGLLSGIAIADVPRQTIFLTGMILIFVEGFSMGVGSFLSEESSEGFMSRRDPKSKLTVRAGTVMFISYFLTGFIPLAPYLFFETSTAFPLSVLAALATLFALGLFAAKLSSRNFLRTGLRMMLIGGSAIILGIVVGALIQQKTLI